MLQQCSNNEAPSVGCSLRGLVAIAREVVTRCDICGAASSDVVTWTLRFDGSTWEVDVDGKTDPQHSLPLSEIVKLGRITESASRRQGDNKFLERRVRNAPQE